MQDAVNTIPLEVIKEVNRKGGIG